MATKLKYLIGPKKQSVMQYFVLLAIDYCLTIRGDLLPSSLQEDLTYKKL